MANRTPIVTGEWYHCYNRGSDKRDIFLDTYDYERLLALMYLCNSHETMRFSEYAYKGLEEFLKRDPRVGEPIVEIAAYSLMPNHYHFVLKQLVDGGVADFMHRVFTSHTTYFNKKSVRSGGLFGDNYQSKHVGDDRYFKHLISYVLLNPVALLKGRKDKSLSLTLKDALCVSQYSSLRDFLGEKRLEGRIVGAELETLYDRKQTFSDLLRHYSDDLDG